MPHHRESGESQPSLSQSWFGKTVWCVSSGSKQTKNSLSSKCEKNTLFWITGRCFVWFSFQLLKTFYVTEMWDYRFPNGAWEHYKWKGHWLLDELRWKIPVENCQTFRSYLLLWKIDREREKETHGTMGNWVLDRNSQEEKMSIKTGHFLGMNKEQLLPDMRWQFVATGKLSQTARAYLSHRHTPHDLIFSFSCPARHLIQCSATWIF